MKPGDTVLSYLVIPFQKGIGDQLSCSSFVRNLAMNKPGSTIDLAVFNDEGRDLYRYNPYVRTIHVIDMQYLNYFRMNGSFRLQDKIKFIARFRKQHYHTVYLLGSKIRFALFAYLIGARERIGYISHHGFTNRRRGFLLTKIGDSCLERNIAERFLDLLAMDGMKIYDPFIELFLSQNESKEADCILSEMGIAPDEKVIALAPFASDPKKTWPLDRFWSVATHFAEKGFTTVILGSARDSEVLWNAHFGQHSRILDVTGKTSILQTAAIIKRCKLFLGNDSGLGHIAGAVRTNSLILGNKMTEYWYPLSPSVSTLIKRTNCPVCSFDTIRQCSKNGKDIVPCFAMITVDEVIQALEAKMGPCCSLMTGGGEPGSIDQADNQRT